MRAGKPHFMMAFPEHKDEHETQTQQLENSSQKEKAIFSRGKFFLTCYKMI